MLKRTDGAAFAVEQAVWTRARRIKGRLKRLLGWSGGSPEILEYIAMKRDNERAAELYRASDFSAYCNERIADHLYAGDLVRIRNSAINRLFSPTMPTTRNVYLQLLHLYYSHLKRIDTKGFLQNHDEPSIGGTADQEVIEGHVVSLDFLQAVEEAYSIREAWNAAGFTGEPKLIAELGAGYGRLAYVCHKMMPECTYVILDLPEGLICAQSWLRQVCDADAVISYSDAARMPTYSRKQLLTARIWTLGAQAIEKLEDVDIFVAADNLSVMTHKIAANYCEHVTRIAKVFFSRQLMVQVDGTAYCAQYPDSNSWRNPSDDIPPQLFAFPKEWVELFSREGSLGNLTEAAYRIRR